MATFMVNAVEHGTFYVGETTDGMVILHPDVFEIEKGHYQLLNGERWRKQTGWYGRLSAPSYLDCTDWSGPYQSEQEASEALNDFYDGEPIEDDIE
jgi:hypothetical protein